jgi:hypothetical protein
MPLDIEQNLGADLPKSVRWTAWAIGQFGYPIVVSVVLLYILFVTLPKIGDAINHNSNAIEAATSATQNATETTERAATQTSTEHAQIIKQDQETIRTLIQVNQQLTDRMAERR